MIPCSHAIAPPKFCVIRVQMHFSNVRYAYFTSAYDVAKNQFVQQGCMRDIKRRMLMKGNGDQGLQTIKVAPLTSIFRINDR